MNTPTVDASPQPKVTLAGLMAERQAAEYQLAAEKGGIERFWTLRLVVDLGGVKAFIGKTGYLDQPLARFLGLVETPDMGDDIDLSDEPDVAPASASFDPFQERQRLRQALAAFVGLPDAPTLPTPLNENIIRLGQALSLNTAECALLGFAALLKSGLGLKRATDLFGPCSCAKISRILTTLLEVPRHEVDQALKPTGRLYRSGFLQAPRRGDQSIADALTISSDGLARRFLNTFIDSVQVFDDLIVQPAPPELALVDFPQMAQWSTLLVPFLQKALAGRRPGVNILVYGAAGVGKTQFARAVIRAVGADSYEVTAQDSDGDPVTPLRRLSAYRGASSLLNVEGKILVFDDAEDVLGGGRDLDSAVASRHGWLNRALESSPIPTFWVVNGRRQYDPAFIRRFDMVIEMQAPPVGQRLALLQAVAADVSAPKVLAQMSRHEGLPVSIVSRAAQVLRAAEDDASSRSAGTGLLTLVNQALKASGQPVIGQKGAETVAYSSEFCNTDPPLHDVAAALRDTDCGARLCLYGPPGTGKSAWARWLGETLGREVFVQRASDLLTPYVGEAEQRVAAAFAKAAQQQAILVMDEVDSFLYSRESTWRSWEVTLVNEMLVQMESFDGVFIATTNRLEGLDSAALRRFDLKVKFDALSGEPASRMLLATCTALGLAPPDDLMLQRCRRLQGATPGDFATVARQARFKRFNSAGDVLDAVVAEVCIRNEQGGKPMGFVVNGR